jgi:hypothetical protein
MGAKYFPELGYYDLYNATIIADQDNTRFFNRAPKFTRIRNLRTDKRIPWREALKEKDRIRSEFNDARWKEFKKDLGIFQQRMPERHWKNVLTDFGFNATPAWLLMGKLTSSLGDSAQLWHMVVLAWLDMILMAVAFFMVYRAFGFYPVMMAIVFFGINYTQRYQHMSGSLLRLDWLAYLLMGISLIKKKRPVSAGFFLAYSSMLRIFPLFYLVGIGTRYLYIAVRDRSFINSDFRLLLSAGVTAVLIFGLTLTQKPGFSAWKQFVGNMSYHSERLTVKRIAIIYPFIYAGEIDKDEVKQMRGNMDFYEWRQQLLDDNLAIIWVLRLAALIVFVYACTRNESWKAAILGIILVYCFTNPARYYWAQLVVLVPLLITTPLHKYKLLAFIALLVTMIISYAIDSTTMFYNVHQFQASVSFGLIFAFILMVFAGFPGKVALQEDEHKEMGN